MKCIEKRVLFMGKRNKVTTRDIAEYTGVSQSTVSMILSNKPHVSFSKETIDKVRQGAKELGYKKPVAGVKKKEQALAKSIIVICPLLSNGYYSMIIHSITERAKDYGYTVFTVSTLRDVSQEELYLNLLSGFELAGVISLYPPSPVSFSFKTSTFQCFLSAYIVYILNNVPANNAASSPPAPALISQIIFLSSSGSFGINKNFSSSSNFGNFSLLS